MLAKNSFPVGEWKFGLEVEVPKSVLAALHPDHMTTELYLSKVNIVAPEKTICQRFAQRGVSNACRKP